MHLDAFPKEFIEQHTPVADFDGFVFNSPFLSWGWDLDGALFKAAMSVAPQVDA